MSDYLEHPGPDSSVQQEAEVEAQPREKLLARPPHSAQLIHALKQNTNILQTKTMKVTTFLDFVAFTTMGIGSMNIPA